MSTSDWLECFKRKHTKQQSTKKKKKTLRNKHETTLNFECPTGISHLQLDQPSYSLGDRHSPSHHQHYLLGGHGLLRRYWFWKTWTKSLKGGCSSHFLREVISVLDCVGEKGELPVVSTTLDRWALGITGNGNDGLLWYWDSYLVFSWCQWLWSHGDGGTCKSSLVLLSCTYVGDMVSQVLSACCWHWLSCSISGVSTMLPFAVQNLDGWSAGCCLGAR